VGNKLKYSLDRKLAEPGDSLEATEKILSPLNRIKPPIPN
jgi:hypothetical protein